MPPKYQPVTSAEARAIHGPRPGSRALHDVVLLRMASRGVRSGGIYNNRMIRGSLRSLSTHSAGRGIDWMVPDKQTGDEIYLRLIRACDQIGVGEVIWRDRRWTGDKGEQPYRPKNHYDHVHCSQTIDMASRPDTPNLRKWFDHFLFGA
ncbi:MAG: hypothetical protein ACKO04_03965 [Actinomycetes bacterium]